MEFEEEFEESEIVGEYRCNTCGIMPLNVRNIIVQFPITGYREPSARIICEGCGKKLETKVDWMDAFLFDRNGAQVEGFSFSRGPELTEAEIDRFKENIESELEKFYEASQ